MQQRTYLLLRQLILVMIAVGMFNDSYAEDTRQRSKNNKAEIQNIKTENKTLRSYIDSLSRIIAKQEQSFKSEIGELDKELAYYKVNQSHFSTAIKLETAVFSTIVTTVFFLLGVFSYFNYNSTFDKVQFKTDEKLRKQKIIIKDSQQTLEQDIRKLLSEQKNTIEDSQQTLNDIIEGQINKQDIVFERVKTQMHNTIEKQFSGQKSKFEILKKEIELDSKSSLSKEIEKHKQEFQDLKNEMSINISKQKADFEGIKSQMETKVGFLLGSQIENFKEQKEKIDANLDLELSNYKKELNNFRMDLIEVECDLLITSGNNFASIAMSCESNQQWNDHFSFSFAAAKAFHNASLKKKESEDVKYNNYYCFIIGNLESAKNTLDQNPEIITVGDLNLITTLDALENSPNNDIKNLIAALRIKINGINIE